MESCSWEIKMFFNCDVRISAHWETGRPKKLALADEQPYAALQSKIGTNSFWWLEDLSLIKPIVDLFVVEVAISEVVLTDGVPLTCP